MINDQTTMDTRLPDNTSYVDGLSMFVADLRLAGYSVDIDQLAAAHQILIMVASGRFPGIEDRISNWITPIFAKSPAQQSDLHQRVEAWRERILPSVPLVMPVVDIPPRPRPYSYIYTDASLQELENNSRRGYIISFIIAIILAVIVSTGLAQWFAGKDISQTASQAPTTPVGQTPSPAQTSDATQIPVTSVNRTINFWNAMTHLFKPVPWPFALPIGLSLLPSLLGIAWWVARLRRKHLWSERASTSPRDLAAIRVLVSDTPIFEQASIVTSMINFTQDRQLTENQIDIDRTVDATARSAGLLTLIMRAPAVIPSYVIIVEEVGLHDHLARFGDIAADRIESLGVVSARYYIARPELARDSTGNRVNLEDIPIRHPNQRLLVIGPGEAIADLHSGRIVRALADENWVKKGFLVAGVIDSTTARRLLKVGFALAPATLEGLKLLSQRFADSYVDGGAILGRLPGVVPRRHHVSAASYEIQVR